ncbi:MAG TPA: hypothetical protein VJW77_14570 [Terriglobia bacterium]|nr:hypothetical protein [Terriglobia bacterium]
MTKKSGGKWRCVYTLDQRRLPVSGSSKELAEAIRRGADLRIYTEFFHDEHINTASTEHELIREVADFRVTYLLESRWTAGIVTLRLPISLPEGFGPRPSMSFFLYNEDGLQGIARPHLDGGRLTGKLGSSPINDHKEMSKYHELENWDEGTNAPSSSFFYEFDVFRFLVNEGWEEVFAHTGDGTVESGSFEALVEEFARGREVKVSVRGLCADMEAPHTSIDHEVFIQTGSCYYYTERKQFIAGSHPVVRVRPAIPLQYMSNGWDFGWLMLRTDGLVVRWLVDPYTLRFQKSQSRHSIRWFVR